MQPDEAAEVCTEADLVDGLRLAEYFHALSVGVRRSSATAAVAFLLTGIAKDVADNPELNPDGFDRLGVAKWLLEITAAQLEAINGLDPADYDRLSALVLTSEIAAPSGTVGSTASVVASNACAQH